MPPDNGIDTVNFGKSDVWRRNWISLTRQDKVAR